MKWIQKIQMIMDEIDKKGFRQRHVIPKLEEFLNRYHQKPERAVAFMEDIQWRLDIDINGKLCGSFAVEDDVMILAENIGIADLCDAEERLSGSSLKSLIKRKEICSEKEGHITVFVYKEKDKKYLKRIGVYDALESYLKKLENFVQLNQKKQ